ncbi:hypothetical protein [Shewanella sp. NIFS-20-20]|uniref:hypothetical protein n=1 Tax=Shewanella sp. NIFS-20-20 TaxID=2853806 RepID=UPI001C462628|nr:hypothetical protein [Shewanella sp. NIFS-20-20]MBV7316654.1 hypothetical protein [Shewanella sp. NIFS-20-20]
MIKTRLKTISNYFNHRNLSVGGSLLLLSLVPNAYGIEFSSVCHTLAGQWSGPAASNVRRYELAHVQAMCSLDRRQLVIMTTLASDMASQTWWFVEKNGQIQLQKQEGANVNRDMAMSLYPYGDGFSFLGVTEVNGRESLLKLIFLPLATGWQWQHQLQYLDDDSNHYQVFLSLDLLPSTSK